MQLDKLTTKCDFTLKSESEGLITGLASVFGNADTDRDVVEQGAFTESLAKYGKPKLLWQHRMDTPIGVVTAIEERGNALYTEALLNLDTQKGKEAYSLIKQGAIDGLSVGMSIIEDTIDREMGVRRIKKARLYEYSVVTFPANESARVLSVKSQKPGTVRELEAALRDAGFSQKEAKAICASGFKGLRDVPSNVQRDVELNLTDVENILRNILNDTNRT